MKKPMPLAVPAQDREQAPFTSSSLPQVESWLEELPRGNPVFCAERLLDVLHASNRAPLLRISRLDLAERLRRSSYDICETLARRYRSAPLPLDETSLQLAQLVSGLYGELAAAFKLGINEAQSSDRPSVSVQPALQVGVQRAILAHGRGLLEAYQTYAPEPVHVWRAVHTLYRNAELLRLQARPIEGTRDTEETALSIKQAYLRMVMLSLCNPYHLMQGDAEELYRRIGRWVHFVRIANSEPGVPLEGLFIVDLDSDLPPRYAAGQHRLPPPLNPRVFEFPELIRTLTAHIDNLNQTLERQKHRTVLSERMQRDMYTRVHHALAGRRERNSLRQPAVARVRLVDGLVATHYFMNGRQEFQPEQDEQRWVERLDLVSGEERGRDLALVASNSDLPAPLSRSNRSSGFTSHDAEVDDTWARAHRISIPEDNLPRERGFRSMVWSRKNESEGGMALFCPRVSAVRTRVGELVAYSNTANSAESASEDWKLGVMRWLRIRDRGGIELGIQHLAENGHAAGSKALSGPVKGSEYLRTLVLPRVNPMIHRTTLITPAAVYDVGTVLALNLGQLVLYAELTELIETTRFYAHFRFKLHHAPATPGADTVRGNPPD